MTGEVSANAWIIGALVMHLTNDSQSLKHSLSEKVTEDMVIIIM